ncbi:MAG: methylated-DNA--[protein]-cysteine S-methyltransferase [Saprospiraceae bacterium]
MANTLSFEDKYEVLVKRDATFAGVFYIAVKTTGIFCRPGCTARTPKPENVTFYNTAHEAILHGFRPCRVCKPEEEIGRTPPYIQAILRELSDKPFQKIKDWDLRQRGIEPSQIRRWFKKHHNMTFHSYQRLLRINDAFTKISNGESITHTAYDIGFESLSGFNDSFRAAFDKAPSQASGQTVIQIVRFTTPLGPMFGCATEKGVCLAEFTDRPMLETEFKDLKKRLNAVILPGENPHLKQLQTELAEYFKGERKAFTIPLHTPGSDFNQAVWALLQTIPFGEIRSYKAQAELLGNPKAVRAVGRANGLNKISIVIPCHRVLGTDGSLVGYGGGLARKRWLLDFEREHAYIFKKN